MKFRAPYHIAHMNIITESTAISAHFQSKTVELEQARRSKRERERDRAEGKANARLFDNDEV